MSNDGIKVIGIVVVKNEDIYINHAISNIVEFCDKIFICDNGSTDKTWKILRDLASKHSKIQLERIKVMKDAQDYISPYAGDKNWIFAVDGDEIYDPEGLRTFRSKLASGEYDHTFSMYGHSMHCVEVDQRDAIARGYLTPESKSCTKLYNFNAITQWTDCPEERLHHGTIIFKDGWHYNMKYPYMNEVSWDDAEFRCLHTCFVKRSSLDKDKGIPFNARPNIADLRPPVFSDKQRFRAFIFHLKRKLTKKWKQQPSKWKLQEYTRGECAEKDVSVFLSKV